MKTRPVLTQPVSDFADDDPADFADLLARIASNGDRAAFARLFNHFAPRLKSHLLQQGLDPDAAESAALEVMVAVWRQAPRFDRRRNSAATFIFRIARNQRLETLRPSRSSPVSTAVPQAFRPGHRLVLVR